MELLSTRLVLRHPAESDVDAICDACQDADIQRFTLVPVPYTRSDAEYFVNVTTRAPESSTWVIRLGDGDEFVGVAGLRCDGAGGATIGYWCAADQRGHGYLAEAVGLVVDDGFSRLGLERINWNALLGNTVSARLAAACGFRYTGDSHEHLGGGRRRPELTELVHTAVLRRDDLIARQEWPAHVLGER